MVDEPGYQPGVTRLHRAVDSNPATTHDFLAMGELDEEEGRTISDDKRARRSYMEGVSCWSTIERMRDINEKFLHKPIIAILDVEKLSDVEADHNPDTGHHNLYGDKEPMREACVDYEEAEAS